jgi:hypothetical protein
MPVLSLYVRITLIVNFHNYVYFCSTADPVTLKDTPITCTMKRISYKEIDDKNDDGGTSDEQVKGMQSLWGAWDDSMRSLKPGEEGDLATILASDTACTAYDKVITEQAADKAKGKKMKPLPPAPPKCRLVMGPMSPEGVQMVFEVIAEPEFDNLPNEPQQLTVHCSAVADNATFKCEGNNEDQSLCYKA